MITMKRNNLKIVISGGGTGGHIFPALSIANEIKRRYPNAEILFFGAIGRMEMERVPAAGYKIIGLPVMGFNRRNLLKNIPVAFNLFKSMRRAHSLIKEFAPDIAIGVGGYVSGPVLKEAQKLGIPTLLQEQNSYAGVTNKLLAKKARKICVAYSGMERFFPAESIVLTGNPVRRDLLECVATPQQARESLGLNPDTKTVLVIGGSLGARSVNRGIIAGIDSFASKDMQVLWQCGKFYAEECAAVLADSGVKNVKVVPFISDMGMAYRAANLVVSRAGAGSISELQLLGKPSILIPSPNVAEDHQTKNAMALVDKGAAILVRDSDSEALLHKEILRVLDDEETLANLSKNISAMALADAAEHIVDEVEKIIGK